MSPAIAQKIIIITEETSINTQKELKNSINVQIFFLKH